VSDKNFSEKKIITFIADKNKLNKE